MAWTAHNDFVAQVGEWVCRGQQAIDATKYKILLLSGTVPTRNMTKGQLFASELLNLNGYARQSYAPAQGAYDGAQQRYEMGTVSTIFLPSGASWSVSGAVVIANGRNQASAPVSAISSNRLTVTAHQLSSAEEIVVTNVDTLPTGLSPSTVYYAKPIDADVVEVYSDAALQNLVTISDSGTGTTYLRYASGTPALIDSSISGTFPDGTPYSVVVDWAWLNTGDVSGA